MTIEKAYCQTCKRDHYFGFDAVGGRLEFLSCQKGRKPVTSEDAIKTPVSVSGTRYNTLLFHDADGQRIYPDAIVSAINEAAALREQVAKLESDLEREERDHLETIDHRDKHEERINAIVRQCGLGEYESSWTSLNDPSERAIEHIEQLEQQVAHLQYIIANTPGASDLQNSTLGQLLVKRNAELERENAALREAAKLARELLTSLPYRNGGGGDVELMIEQLTTAIGAKP